MESEFKDEYNYNNIFNEEEDDFAKILDKALDEELDLTNGDVKYIDKLEVEQITNEELLKLDKIEILNFKDKQIKKLNQYIRSLEREKDDLILNFKNTTNILLEQLKEKEFKENGERPRTAVIAEKIKNSNINNHNNNSNSKSSSNQSIAKVNNIITSIKEDSRCPLCKQIVSNESLLAHNLDCYRNNFMCKICQEVVHRNNKTKHLDDYKNLNVKIKIILNH